MIWFIWGHALIPCWNTAQPYSHQQALLWQHSHPNSLNLGKAGAASCRVGGSDSVLAQSQSNRPRSSALLWAFSNNQVFNENKGWQWLIIKTFLVPCCTCWSSLLQRQSGRFPVCAIAGPMAGHTEAAFPKAKCTDERLVSISEHGKFRMRVHSAKIINPQLYIWSLYIRVKWPKGCWFTPEIFPEASRMD